MSDTEREVIDEDLDIDEEQSEDVAGGAGVHAEAAAATERRVSLEAPPEPL